MNKIQLDSIEIKSWGSRKEPPTEIRLFKFGINKTSKGEIWLTKKDAQTILSRKEDRGLDLLADFEHSMANPSPEGAPASAKFKLCIRTDGLYATKIQWSDRALEYFSKREYFYYSPFVQTEKRIDGKEYVVDLVNFALTNLPATDNLIPLILSSNDFPVNISKNEKVLNMNLDELKEALNKLFAENGLSPELSALLAAGVQELIPSLAPEEAQEEAPAPDGAAPGDEQLTQVLSSIEALKTEVAELRKVKTDHETLMKRLTSAKAPVVTNVEKKMLSTVDLLKARAKQLSADQKIAYSAAYELAVIELQRTKR